MAERARKSLVFCLSWRWYASALGKRRVGVCGFGGVCDMTGFMIAAAVLGGCAFRSGYVGGVEKLEVWLLCKYSGITRPGSHSGFDYRLNGNKLVIDK